MGSKFNPKSNRKKKLNLDSDLTKPLVIWTFSLVYLLKYEISVGV